MTKRVKISLIFLVFFLFLAPRVQAQDLFLIKNKELRLNRIFLDQATIAKGYTVKTDDDYLKLSLVPGILSADTEVLIEEIEEGTMPLPWGLKKESDILQFEFKNKAAYKDENPFYIQFSYNEKSDNYKQVFFYDKGRDLWRPLPSQDFPEEKFVRSLIHLPYARIAVFSHPQILSLGSASWYKYKNGDFAASPDFPKGSKLRVKNLENNKFVDVEVNDYGPDRSLHPDRVIDLDVVAFKKIADSRQGLINVVIEPLNIIADSYGRKLDMTLGRGTSPEIRSESFILLREKNNQVLLGKNENKALPIASLTKIFSVFNFLEEKKGQNYLDEIVKYNVQDEKYNLNYFPKWELALINLKDGDLLSIKDLIYSSLVRSANNAVETLVRFSGLERSQFIQKVNLWASANGATTFKIFEPTGLDKNNVASASDLAKLAKIVFSNPLLSSSSIAPKYEFYTRNDKSLKLGYNSSDLVLRNNFSNFKIIGSKTGYLEEAGYCLISRAEINGEKFIAVILNSPTRSGSFKETEDLFNYAYYLSVANE